jgi:SAM-dependent methyltransferase
MISRRKKENLNRSSEGFPYSWEEAVNWLRNQQDQEGLVKNCYYDDPLEDAAERFLRSEEFTEVLRLLRGSLPGDVLDVGAGRGISSYAFAKSGCNVTALEPYQSSLVGLEAIQNLVIQSGAPINVVQGSGESIPFPENSFDVVYCRAALHHADDLARLCFEAARVLKKTGFLLATREHVISSSDDLEQFLRKHPLHHLYGGESAYTLREYTQALGDAGLRLKKVIGPFDSVVNYAPMTRREWESRIHSFLTRYFGHGMALRLSRSSYIRHLVSRFFSRRSDSPGRLYSFLAQR